MYKQKLMDNIEAFLWENEMDPRVYVQGNVVAAMGSLEAVKGLNQMQACKVFRKIQEVERASECEVNPVDYVAFIREIVA